LGQHWASQIFNSLEASSAVLVLLSRQSINSEWVRREWLQAVHRVISNEKARNRVIPVLTGGIRFEDIPPQLAQFQAISLDEDYDAGLVRLEQAIKSAQRSDAPPLQSALDIDKIAEAVEQRIASRLGLQSSSRSAAQRPVTLVDPNFVFVVMSFDASMEPAYDAVKAAAEVCGLVAKRVKDVPGDYRITDKMLGLIASARLIVVDLSLERPNVYFELGYARGLGKRVITILRKGSTAHFDVRDWQYLEYVDSRPLEKDLADRFRYELQRGEEDD
jgi:TIR domain